VNDISSLIEQDLGLPKRIGGWLFWQCPFHQGDDTPSLGVKNNRYFCFACQAWGDGVDWLTEYRHLPKIEALRLVKGNYKSVKATFTPKAKDIPPLVKPNDAWQNATLSEVILAHKNLFEPQGQAVRDYLINRGITESSWITWTLGSGYAYHPLIGHKVEALVIPHFDGNWRINAIKYRFLTGNLRYLMRKGSKPTLYGLWQQVKPILVVCEGELNAISISQVLGDKATVISPGSESGGKSALIALLKSPEFTTRIVWLDEPDLARQYELFADIVLSSPVIDGVKMDANRLLQESLLPAFMERLLGDTDPGGQTKSIAINFVGG